VIRPRHATAIPVITAVVALAAAEPWSLPFALVLLAMAYLSLFVQTVRGGDADAAA
jgi:hypothetical protein